MNKTAKPDEKLIGQKVKLLDANGRYETWTVSDTLKGGFNFPEPGYWMRRRKHGCLVSVSHMEELRATGWKQIITEE